jgi:hypothetical protein
MGPRRWCCWRRVRSHQHGRSGAFLWRSRWRRSNPEKMASRPAVEVAVEGGSVMSLDAQMARTRERLVKYEMAPPPGMESALPLRDGRPGKCFQDAEQIILDADPNFDLVLVHGKCQAPGGGQTVHAWVEVPGGLVYMMPYLGESILGRYTSKPSRPSLTGATAPSRFWPWRIPPTTTARGRQRKNSGHSLTGKPVHTRSPFRGDAFRPCIPHAQDAGAAGMLPGHSLRACPIS